MGGEGHTRQVQPLGLGYVGAAIADQHDVRFLLPDTRSYTGDDPWGGIARAVADEAPDVVGLTSVTADYPAAARLAAVIKAVDPEICDGYVGQLCRTGKRSGAAKHHSVTGAVRHDVTHACRCPVRRVRSARRRLWWRIGLRRTLGDHDADLGDDTRDIPARDLTARDIPARDVTARHGGACARLDAAVTTYDPAG